MAVSSTSPASSAAAAAAEAATATTTSAAAAATTATAAAEASTPTAATGLAAATYAANNLFAFIHRLIHRGLAATATTSPTGAGSFTSRPLLIETRHCCLLFWKFRRER